MVIRSIDGDIVDESEVRGSGYFFKFFLIVLVIC